MGRRLWFVAVAAISVGPVIATSVWWPDVTSGVATAISMSWSTGSAAFDMMRGQLPDVFIALALLPVVMAAALLPMQGRSTALPDIGYGAASWALPLVVVHLVSPGALGFGDVKASAVLGAALGLTLSAFAVAVSLVVALASASSVGLTTGRRTIALGPYLAGGALASLMVDRFVGKASW